MYAFAGLTCLFLILSHVPSFPGEDIPNVEPEYLDMLLETHQYELFSKLMRIDNVNLVRPGNRERTEKPMYHKEIALGDILPARPATEEGSRQTLIDPDYKWENGYVPYAISNHYDDDERKIILNGIRAWNNQVSCIKFKPRRKEKNYVMFFSGDGCYSSMGCEGGQQPLSLDYDGCLYKEIILHEMEHAIGIGHEQNRADRDEHIKMLWRNIPKEWWSQFEKCSTDDCEDVGRYDLDSIMHYEVTAPDSDKPAFEVRDKNVDTSQIGKGKNFSKEDLNKLSYMYCGK